MPRPPCERRSHAIANGKAWLTTILAIVALCSLTGGGNVRRAHWFSELGRGLRAPPGSEFGGRHQSRTEQHRRIGAIPLVEVWPRQILDGRKLLSRETEFVNVPVPRPRQRPHDSEQACFPIMFKGRLVGRGLDPTEPLFATEVVNAIHILGPGRRDKLKIALGADHAVARDQSHKIAILPSLGTLGALRQDQISKLGRAVPDLDRNILR